MPTANMNLPIPTVSQTGGPQWASDNNSAFTILDAHDHSPGSGVQITPDGLNINSDFPLNSNNLTLVKSVRFVSQPSPLAGPSDLGCLYEAGVDLYYNDGNGNQIQLTSGGGVAGSPGSIGSLSSPAAATYNAGSTKFIWTSDTNKYAAMDNGAVTIRETNVASANGITLQSPNSLASAYSLTLPAALPGSTQYLTSSSGGILSFSSADSIGSAMTSTGSNSISAVRTRSTGTSVGVGGIAISDSSGSFNTTIIGWADVTNLSVTITTSGRPVYLQILSDAVLSSGIYGGGGTPDYVLRFLRDSTTIVGFFDMTTAAAAGSFAAIDVISAGTYTYKVQVGRNGASSVTVFGCKLAAFEL